MHEALLQTPQDGRILCGLCPNACVIAEGAAGICGARGVVGGRLQALTYGLVSSIAADPIEKKPVFHFRPGTRVLSIGSVGCSMRCGHCQNWQISRPRGADGSVDLRNLTPAEVLDLAVETECEGVAFTYNEPVIWLEYVLDCARLAKQAGLYTVMVTNGYVTEAGLDLFAEVIDVWRVDIKGFSEETYRELCHVRHPEEVRRQAARARHVHGMHVECVTNLIPTVNDSDAEVTAVAEWIANELGRDTPWHLTRFIPYLEYAHLPMTPLASLEHARDIGMTAGLDFIYLGNVDVPGGEDTRCPECGGLVVARRGFSVVSDRLASRGTCATCGAALNFKEG